MIQSELLKPLKRKLGCKRRLQRAGPVKTRSMLCSKWVAEGKVKGKTK